MMTDNDAPKSAYELAMERLRKKDADAGVTSGPVSDEQKAEIAEVRRVAEARVAELTIMHQSKTAGILDPAVREVLDQELRHDVQRINEQRDRQVAAIRERRS